MYGKLFEYDVFLSYSSKDKSIIHTLAERLKNDGMRVWLDKWSIKPGDSIPLKIQEGLEKSRTLLICMSSAYFESEWGKLEHLSLLFRDPTNKNRRLIPLLIVDCTRPDIIAHFAYIDWRSCSDEAYYMIFASCLEREDTIIRGFSSGSKIQTISRYSDSELTYFGSVDPTEKNLNIAKGVAINTVNIPEPSQVGRNIAVATTKSIGIQIINVNGEKKCLNIFIKNYPLLDGTLTVSKIFRTIKANQRTVTIILCENDSMEEFIDFDPDFELFMATFELPGNLPANAPIEITFSLDNEGIFAVNGKDLTSNKEVHGTLHLP